jgi:type VI secretion system protein ImpL
VRQVVDTARKYEGHVPLGMRFGLYQGNAMTSTAEDAYFREMNNSLIPAVAHHFAGRIQAAGAQPDKLYEYLKAYLMLSEPKQRLDPAQMQLIGRAEWSRAFGSQPEAAQRLATHFNAFTDGSDSTVAGRRGAH